MTVKASDLVPTSWLDPLLSGREAVIGRPPYNCKDIEILLSAIKKRIMEYEQADIEPPKAETVQGRMVE